MLSYRWTMLQVDRAALGALPAGDLPRVTLAALSDAVVTTDARAFISFLNPAAEELLGWDTAIAAGSPLSLAFDVFRDGNRDTALNPVETCLRTGKAALLDDDAVLVHRNGKEIPIEGAASPIVDPEFGIIGAVLNFRDVSGRRNSIRRLRYQAHHDPLTGLENRRSFELAFTQFLAEVDGDWPGAFLYLDLDEFKVVNDTGGHLAGDTMLRHISAIMQTCVGPEDCLARLGGDEFGILLKGCSRERALEVANGLRQAIAEFRLDWNGKSFSNTTSVGVVPIPASGASVSSLLVAADDCAYLAKSGGGNQVRIFEVGDTALLQRHDQMEWVGRIQEALRNDHFCLYCQPILALQECQEAPWSELLLRIRDEQGNIFLPTDFVPAAEKFGLIAAIDRWVIQHGFEDLRRKKEECKRQLYSINISGMSLGDESFLAFVVDELAKSRIDPSQLCFEITETAAVRSFSLAVRFISTLKELGCRFALDDFGMGLSSFAYLRTLSVDYLKIPGRFVRSMATDALDRAVVEGIQRMANVMNLKSIAEHIEDEATLAEVKKLGIEYGQGNFLGQATAL